MTNRAAWDVVVVPFPYADKETEKHRPALIVSANALSEQHGLYWLLMITSAKNPGWKGDVAIKDLEGCGLPVPSVIRPAKMATVDATRVLRSLGQLPRVERAAVRAALRRFLVR